MHHSPIYKLPFISIEFYYRCFYWLLAPCIMALLEELLTELRVLILRRLSDVPTLQRFVQSSPIYHRKYRRQRIGVPSDVICNELTPKVFLLALSAVEAHKIPSTGDRWSNVFRYLDSSLHQEPIYRVDITDLIAICRFQSAIRSMATTYLRQAQKHRPWQRLNNLIKLRKGTAQCSSPIKAQRLLYNAIYSHGVFLPLFCLLGRENRIPHGDVFAWSKTSTLESVYQQ